MGRRPVVESVNAASKAPSSIWRCFLPVMGLTKVTVLHTIFRRF